MEQGEIAYWTFLLGVISLALFLLYLNYRDQKKDKKN